MPQDAGYLNSTRGSSIPDGDGAAEVLFWQQLTTKNTKYIAANKLKVFLKKILF